MRIDYVEIAGFRGFKTRTRVNIPSGFAVLTGRNGTGKSTVFDAIDFALTGTISKYDVRVAKGGGLEDHVWWVGDGHAAESFVCVGFVANDGERIAVTRRRDGSVDEKMLSDLLERFCLDRAVNPNWIATLMATSLIRDERISALSLDLTEQARFTAVREALGADEASAYEERTKEILKLIKSSRDEQVTRHAKVHEELGRALSSLTDVRSSEVEETDTATVLERLRRILLSTETDTAKLVAEARSFLVQERQNVVAMRSALAAADRLSKDENEQKLEADKNELTELVAQRAGIESELAAAKITLGNASDELQKARETDERTASHIALLDLGSKLGLVEGKCPLCAAPHSEEEFNNLVASARDLIANKTPAAATASQQHGQARETVRALEQKLSSVTAKAAALDEAIGRRQLDIDAVSKSFVQLGLGNPTDLPRATQILLGRQEAVTVIEGSLFALETSRPQDRVSSLENRVAQLRVLVETEASRLNDAERAVEAAQQIEKSVRQVANELLSEQFDTVLPLLKELYRRLRPHADWTEIEIDIAGKLRASLNFTVGDGYNPQFLFSSGQRRAAGLAFLLAVHLSRPWCALNTLMLDDPIQHIDDYRSLNLVEVLSAIRRGGRQIVIAVEDKALADVLCRRLRSSTNEPGVRLDFGTNESGSAEVQSEMIVMPFETAVFGIAEAS